MAKKIHDQTFIGEGGTAVVQKVLMEMRYGWLPTGRFDAGIDGYIELRDSQSKEMLGAHLGAQVKTRAKFTAETDETFEFRCEQEDIDYWMRSNLPVLLICVRSESSDAWYVCATEYFSDPDVRASRRLVFHKHEDRFDKSVASVLRDLALPPDAGVSPQGLTGPETLLTNLLPVHHGQKIWRAPTTCSTTEQANAKYAEVDGPRASDYLLRDRCLYSLRDPRTCELRRICDAEKAEAFDAADWARSENADLQRRFAALLRRTLLQQLKPRIQWSFEREVFYFATRDMESVSMTGPTGRSRDVVAVKRFTGYDGQERIGNIKHLAFKPRFVRFEGDWYLEVSPDWHYTWDGEREHRKAGQLRRGLKSMERNGAVTGHLRFWEHTLTRNLAAFDGDEVPLRFGPLRTERVAVGIDDKAWTRKTEGKPAPASPKASRRTGSSGRKSTRKKDPA